MNRGGGSTNRGFPSPRGRSSPSAAGHYSSRGRHMTDVDGSYSDGPFISRGGISRHRRGNASRESFQSYSNPGAKNVWKSKDETFRAETLHNKQNASNSSSPKSKQLDSEQLSTLRCDFSSKIIISPLQMESQPFVHFGDVNLSSQERSGDPGISNNDNLQANKPFDICLPKKGGVLTLNPSLHTINRQRRNDAKRASEEQGIILEQGMVLLKGFLSVEEQVKIVKQCRLIGKGPGGFYQPGYLDGAKLQLKMMCLGKNWDPNTSQYGENRPIDGAKPPVIPVEFRQLVDQAIKSCHALVARNSKTRNVEDIIPRMSPDICIVNFYSTSGRLGLHQDKDESEGSLKKGLPVVSFSIGDTGEFRYGDSREEKDTKKVMLESGDALIFGGKSRHIFHGVESIMTNTAPVSMVHETNLRPGRLNLTFRQY